MSSARIDEVDQPAQIKQRYASICSDVYSEILSQGAVASMPGWTRSKNDEYGVTTWTLTEGKPSHRVGSNGQLVVKLFDDKSYDYVKSEDFIERVALVFDAATKLISQYTKDDNLQQQLAHWIVERKTSFKHEIMTECKIDVDIVLGKEGPEIRSQHFSEKANLAKDKIQQLIIDLAVRLQVLTQKANAEPLAVKEITHQIRETEKAIIAENGRPAVIKIGAIGDPKQQQQMVSMQFPQGEKTLPSSLRTGTDANIKLSNHVLDGSGHIVDGKVQLDVMVEGHSSYSPIDEKDELVRRYVALQAVKEKIASTVKNIQLANPDSDLGKTIDKPLTISSSTMMLLTPAVGKWIEDIARGSESEHDQLSVSSRALEGLRHSKQPLEIQGLNGEKLYVNVDINYMNLPTNIGKTLQEYTEDKLQTAINARGFYEYCNNMEDALNRFSGDEAALTADIKIAEIQTNLSGKYQELERALHNYNTDPELKAKSKEDYKTIKNDIIQIEKKLFNEYQRINNEREKDFKSKPETELRQERKAEIQLQLQDESLLPALRNHLMLEDRFIRTQEMFYNKDYLTSENAYKFHVLYLLSNEQAGRHIEAFCKSAEDRTGWLRVSMLAHTAFNQVNGRDPDFNNKDDRENYDRFYATKAHELSASLENTEHNSKARGLQVSAKFTNQYIGMDLGKEMAGFAKAVFKHLDTFGCLIHKTATLPPDDILKDFKRSFIVTVDKDKTHLAIYYINENGSADKCLETHNRQDIKTIKNFVDSQKKQNIKELTSLAMVKSKLLDTDKLDKFHSLILQHGGELPYYKSPEVFLASLTSSTPINDNAASLSVSSAVNSEIETVISPSIAVEPINTPIDSAEDNSSPLNLDHSVKDEAEDDFLAEFDDFLEMPKAENYTLNSSAESYNAPSITPSVANQSQLNKEPIESEPTRMRVGFG